MFANAKPPQGERIAVIGAGPAGLTYASLVADGNSVTVFDKAGRAGLSVLSLGHLMSKRTTLYAEFDHTSYRKAVVSTLNPAGVSSQTAFTVGIDHLF